MKRLLLFGVLGLCAQAQDYDIHLARGHPRLTSGRIGRGSSGRARRNCSGEEGVSYYVPGTTHTDGVNDDF